MNDSQMPVPTPSYEVRQGAMLCHLAAFLGFVFPFGSVVGPLILWQMKKELDPFIDDQGKEALEWRAFGGALHFDETTGAGHYNVQVGLGGRIFQAGQRSSTDYRRNGEYFLGYLTHCFQPPRLYLKSLLSYMYLYPLCTPRPPLVALGPETN